jgi:hypothetical protein
MFGFVKSTWFKYLKNLIIGLGAALVMMGALGKINSEPWGGFMITVGLVTEAFLFLILGLIPPEKDYYWEKLYPGIEKYGSNISPLSAGEVEGVPRNLNADMVEGQLDGMLTELTSMAKSLGSLKALQEIDFDDSAEKIKTMNNFYSKMTEAMSTLNETVEDTKSYRENLAQLNQNLAGLNGVYGNVLSAFTGGLKK